MPRTPSKRQVGRAPRIGCNSLGVYISLLFNAQERDDLQPCPVWPPDLFAVVASVLYQTGEYRQIIQPEPYSGVLSDRKAKWRKARSAGRSWRSALDKKIESGAATLEDALAASEIPGWWQTLNANAHVPLNSIDREIVDVLLMLFFAADEACAGLGMTHLGDCPRNRTPDDMPALTEAPFFQGQAERVLKQFNGSRSLCLHVRPEMVCVLPKLHTAQVGLTLRSLSHNLALCRASGIETFWNGPIPSAERIASRSTFCCFPGPTRSKPARSKSRRSRDTMQVQPTASTSNIARSGCPSPNSAGSSRAQLQER